MKRVTSSLVIAAKSDAASLVRSSRSVTTEPASSGSPVRQSFGAGPSSASGSLDATGSESGSS